MAEKFQSLLDKINEKGVKAAEASAATIVEAAEKEAKAIRDKAKADAEASAKHAEEHASSLQKRAESAIRQAARDIILELQQELESRLTRAVSDAANQALTPEFMAQLVKELAGAFAAKPNDQLTVLTALKDVAPLDAALKASLKSSFVNAPKVFGDAGIKGGLEVNFKNGEVYFDFSSEAITELVGDYIGPRLFAILSGK
ncbi:MAG: hypothetical protein LBM70_07580 [Victivallales bacterium]|jgi:V/A-type H+-transporting ATPase subunit E|nr:hypothetical protein [Victivallales bacterium]